MRTMVGAIKTGRAGEFRVSSDLHLRRVPCYSPTVDCGVDLLTSFWNRVQVKTSSIVSINGWSGYAFRNLLDKKKPHRENADVFVCWGKDEDRFWVVPGPVVGNRPSFYAPSRLVNAPSKSALLSPYENRWDLLVPAESALVYTEDECIGIAGTHRVISELLLRDVQVSQPVVDIGFDLITAHGVRIQVKASRISTRQYKDGAYYFSPTRRYYKEEGKRLHKDDRVPSDEYDFAIFWGIEQNRFWIVPSALLGNKGCITLGPKPAMVEIDMEEVRRRREAGESHEKIAASMGINTTTLWNLDKGVTKSCDRHLESKAIRDCEGRWDYITEHIADLSGGRKVFDHQTVATTP